MLLLLMSCTGSPEETGAPDDTAPTDTEDTGEAPPAFAGDDFALWDGELKVFFNVENTLETDVGREQAVGNPAHFTTLADFDGDGLDDVWQVADGSNKVNIFLNDGASWASEVVFDPKTGAGGKELFVGDFNGDGKDDIAFFSGVGRLVVVHNDLGQFWWDDRVVTEYALFAGDGQYGVMDLDGDGTDDLIHRSGSDLTVVQVLDMVPGEVLLEMEATGVIDVVGIDIDDNGFDELGLWSGSTLRVHLNTNGALAETSTDIFFNKQGTPMAGQAR